MKHTGPLVSCNRVLLFLGGILVLLSAFALSGCVQALEPPPASTQKVYSLVLSVRDYNGLALSGSDYTWHYLDDGTYPVAPEPVTLTVTNTGNTALEGVNIVLSGPDTDKYAIDVYSIPLLAVGAGADIQISLPQGVIAGDLFEAVVLIGNANAAERFPLSVGIYDFIDDSANISIIDTTTTLPVTLVEMGSSYRAEYALDSQGMQWFSTDPNVLTIDAGSGMITPVATGRASFGLLSANPFGILGTTIMVVPSGYTPDTTPPYIKQAEVQNTARDIVQVTFSEPVAAVDITKFTVKASDKGPSSIGAFGPTASNKVVLDYGAVPRAITAAVATSGDSSVWDLTMDANANFGEILRLVADADAVTDDSIEQNGMLAVPEGFIIRNLVELVKPPLPAAGFYETAMGGASNGSLSPVAGFTDPGGGSTYQAVITWLRNTASNAPTLNGKWVYIVLDQNQTITAPAGGADPNSTGNIVITTVDGGGPVTITASCNNAAAITGANGGNLTWVLDENVTLKGTNITNQGSLVLLNGGNKFILNGGKLIDNTMNGTGGGSNGRGSAVSLKTSGSNTFTSFIMIDGEISGNIANVPSGQTMPASTISLFGPSIFVMYGGGIRNNEVTGTAGARIRAGAVISDATRATDYSGGGAIYITGGTIENNSVTGTQAAASAGAILSSGTFQKTGGTIAPDNTTAFTGNINPGKVAFIFPGATDQNPVVTGLTMFLLDTKLCDTTVQLFIHGGKSSGTAWTTGIIPPWAAHTAGNWE